MSDMNTTDDSTSQPNLNIPPSMAVRDELVPEEDHAVHEEPETNVIDFPVPSVSHDDLADETPPVEKHDYAESWDASDIATLRTYVHEGMSNQEIADRMGRTLKAVQSKKYRLKIKSR